VREGMIVTVYIYSCSSKGSKSLRCTSFSLLEILSCLKKTVQIELNTVNQTNPALLRAVLQKSSFSMLTSFK